MQLPGPVRVLVAPVQRITTGSLPSTVACPRCGQDAGLRLVAVGPHLAVICCDAWHPRVLDGLAPAEVDRQAGPDIPRWHLAGGQVPAELEAEHPGIGALLDRLGGAWRSGARHVPAPAVPTRLSNREAERLDDATTRTLSDDGGPDRAREGQHPDETLLVPVTRRELRLLRALTYAPDPGLDAPGRVLRGLGQDLLRRAEALVAPDGEHAGHVLADHSTGMDLLLHLRLHGLRGPYAPAPADWD